ncbi:L-fucose:H+ symporter permease [Spirosoma utsteinense]|uniref:FHS family L-fucose permease-like MFS transporter n=1 Tax=Spirosoma utsteinense TaxID=2585773 RepID=A0ABR6W7V7_9BACT|nr:L-fucose:H+ symporter permease [Spirosoma utsteinense]MBC3787729.1 FHS family L-fucose permease-like MFS transporter [Spirosoma utsteinense]MBC3792667.1 FHS family L-fucose permease-like MFS transporter [Spirosoma utsteinense]
MALGPTTENIKIKEGESTGNVGIAFVLVTSLFFLWGLANSLNGSLIKQFQIALDLNRFQAGIVDFAFYLGYFFMALPAGYVMRKYGYKRGILFGLLLYGGGAFLFYPAAEVRVYSFFLFALFTMACGIAFLETAANLYVTVLGDPAKSEWRLNFSQSFNGISLILGPIIGAMFIFSKTEYTPDMLTAMAPAAAEAIRVEEALSVQGPYLVIGLMVAFMALLFAITKMPEVGAAEEQTSGSVPITRVLRHRHLSLGIIAQFANVGAQATLWGYFVDLKLDFSRDGHWALAQAYMNAINTLTGSPMDMSPTQIAGFHASFALVLFMIGRFVGTSMMTRIRPNRVLAIFSAGSVAMIILSMLTGGVTAVIALSFTYFFQSIMFPTIFALSTKNLGASESKIASSLVIMSIVGGALMPLVAGALFARGAVYALAVPLICFAFIVYYALNGYQSRRDEVTQESVAV